MFQHTERRVELGCEQQRDMEQAFEGLFIKTHGRLCFIVCCFMLQLHLELIPSLCLVVVSRVASSTDPAIHVCNNSNNSAKNYRYNNYA